MKLIKEFDKLYGTSLNGTKEWTVSVYEDDGYGIIKTYYGSYGGKITESEKVIYEKKNLGKSNETTPIEQALLEAQRMFNKKNKTYFTTLSKVKQFNQTNFLPMLAHVYSKRKKDIVYPAYVQPKLDGVRCIVTEDTDLSIFPKYYSRTGKEFKTLNLLDEDIFNFDLSKYNIDGEIYTQDLDFNNISSAVRSGKKLNEYSKLLNYWVFDLDIKLTTFDDRFQELINVFGKQEPVVNDILKINSFNRVKMCPTFIVNSENEILKYHKLFVKLGYEGTIIRNKKGYYLHGKRSKHLQKMKDFMTDEFIVVDINSGEGEDTGLAIFTCITKNGKRFKVRPSGSGKIRAEYLNNYQKYINKPYTVKYQSITKSGSLRFPTGVGFRDYE